MRDILLLFSGGRDSMLAACELIESDHRVHLFTADNGCISNIQAVDATAQRLLNRYGPNAVIRPVFVPIAGLMQKLTRNTMNCSLQELSKRYPYLRPAQVTCLMCHTCIYHAAIQYCKEQGLHALAEGARENQKFVITYEPMLQRYRALAWAAGIELLWPVYDVPSDWERKLRLAERGFIPKVLEPQCWLGAPLGQELCQEEIDDLIKFYDENLVNLPTV